MRLLVICLLACLFLFSGERASAQRYLPRQVGIQLTAGTVDGFLFRNKYTERLFHCGLALSRYNRNKSRWVVGADYFQKEYRYRTDIIPRSQFTLEGGYYVPFLSNRGKDIFLSAGLSALAGYETIN